MLLDTADVRRTAPGWIVLLIHSARLPQTAELLQIIGLPKKASRADVTILPPQTAEHVHSGAWSPVIISVISTAFISVLQGTSR